MGPEAEKLIDRLRSLEHPEVDALLPDLIEHLETLTIDARTEEYRVNIAEFEPKPGTTIVLSLPKSAPKEAFVEASKALKRYFPDHKAIVMHEDAELSEDASGETR